MSYLQTLAYVERTFFEIKAILLNDSTVRQLLYFDTSDALNKVPPTVASVETYVHITPLSKQAIKTFNQTTFMTIDIPSIDFLVTDQGQNALSARGYVSVFTDTAHWLLDDNKMRLLRLADRIASLLNKTKISAAGSIEILKINRISLDSEMVGMTVEFAVFDDQTVTLI